MAIESRVCIVDDDPGSLGSIATALLTREIPTHVFTSANEFLAEHPKPSDNDYSCFLVDLLSPNNHRIWLIEQIRESCRITPIIAISGNADVAMAVLAMKAGATEFVEHTSSEEVVRLITESIRAPSRPEGRATKRGFPELSDRERQVLDLLVDGLANKQVAAELGISSRTVEKHREKIMQKTNATSLAQLVRLALSRA